MDEWIDIGWMDGWKLDGWMNVYWMDGQMTISKAQSLLERCQNHSIELEAGKTRGLLLEVCAGTSSLRAQNCPLLCSHPAWPQGISTNQHGLEQWLWSAPVRPLLLSKGNPGALLPTLTLSKPQAPFPPDTLLAPAGVCSCTGPQQRCRKAGPAQQSLLMGHAHRRRPGQPHPGDLRAL